MKKSILFFICLLCATFTFAQEKKGSVGIGYMRPNCYYPSLDLNGVYLGFDYNVPIAKNFGVAPGLYYSCSAKNRKLNSLDMIVSQYVGIPCNFFYSADISQNTRVNVFAGPTLSYGMSLLEIEKIHRYGEIKYETTDLYAHYGGWGGYYGVPTGYQRLFLMIGGGVSFDFSNTVRFTLGYDYGIIRRRSKYYSPYYRNFPHVGVSYLF